MSKSVILLLISFISLFLANTHPVRSQFQSLDTKDASNLAQVNDSAFGLGSGDNEYFLGEEAKELLVFDGQLYLGMEADDKWGARLWRTMEGVTAPSSQSDWEEVIADAWGQPFGISNIAQNDHIDSLAEFNNYLYVSTGNRGNGDSGVDGTLLFRSPTGDSGSWGDPVTSAGFGDTNNENFKDMIVFQGWLCGGTWNQIDGAEVWCSQNGTGWIQKNISGFGLSTNNPKNIIVVHTLVFDNQLYVGVENGNDDGTYGDNDIAKLFRTADINAANPAWQEVYSGSAGSLNVDLLGELDGYLYIATASAEGIITLRSHSGDYGSWDQVNTSGMNGNPKNSHTYNDSSLVIDNYLYVAVSNQDSGFEVWRTSGNPVNETLVDWEQFGPSGWSDSDNVKAGLVKFNDLLYAWTTNYQSGQQVRRATSLTLFHNFLPLIEQSVD